MYLVFIHSYVDRPLGSFHVLDDIANRAAMTIGCMGLFELVFLGHMPSSGIAASYGSSIFGVIKDLPH